MALNIKNKDVEALAAELAGLTGESKTQAIKTALEERRARLRYQRRSQDRERRLIRYLENEIWPLIPKDLLGKPIAKEEREEILGYGKDGV